jgi:hypothetical protein
MKLELSCIWLLELLAIVGDKKLYFSLLEWPEMIVRIHLVLGYKPLVFK